MGIACDIPRKHNLTADSLILWLLQSCYLVYSNSLSIRYRNVLQMYPFGLDSTMLHFDWL